MHCWTSSRFQKTYSHLFSVTSDTKVMNLRLSHDCQKHTCRCCNRAGHFANECANDFCFNCEEIGHLSPDCEEGLRCCICKCTSHLARACRYSWYRSPSTSLHAQPPSNNGQSSGQAKGQQQNSQSDRQNDDFGHSDPPTVNNNSPGAPANESSESPQQDPPATLPENSNLRPSDRPSPSSDPEKSSGRILDSQGELISQPSERELNSCPTPPMQSSIVLTQDDDSMSADLFESSQPPSAAENVDSPPSSSGAKSSSKQSSFSTPSRHKPASIISTLSAMGRRPTKPTLVTTGKKTTPSAEENLQSSPPQPTDDPPLMIPWIPHNK